MAQSLTNILYNLIFSKNKSKVTNNNLNNGDVAFCTEDKSITLKYDNELYNMSSSVPSGVIVMWSGNSSNIPTGWALCDGTNGTPNLIDKFIKSSNSSGDTGGSNSKSIILNSSNLPSHSHTTNLSHTHTASSNSTGSHTHTISLSNLSGTTTSSNSSGLGGYIIPIKSADWSLIMMQPGPSTSGYSVPGSVYSNGTSNIAFTRISSLTQGVGVTINGSASASSAGSHSHTITINDGGGSSVTSSSTGSGTAFTVDTTPTYYALCFIMKL